MATCTSFALSACYFVGVTSAIFYSATLTKSWMDEHLHKMDLDWKMLFPHLYLWSHDYNEQIYKIFPPSFHSNFPRNYTHFLPFSKWFTLPSEDWTVQRHLCSGACVGKSCQSDTIYDWVVFQFINHVRLSWFPVILNQW